MKKGTSAEINPFSSYSASLEFGITVQLFP